MINGAGGGVKATALIYRYSIGKEIPWEYSAKKN